MKKVLLIATLIFHFLQGIGQHRIGDFMAYGNNNGLPAALYYSVLQSSDGYLWMGSTSGVVRFDGKRYKVFFSEYTDTNSLADNIIVDLVEDDQQNLWMAGFYQGLTKYNLKSGRIQRYSRLSNDKTPGYGINSLLKSDDGIWIATAGRGLAHYLPAQDSFEFFIPDPLKPSDGSDRLSNHVADIAIDKSDSSIFWLATFDGLYSFNRTQNTFERFFVFNPEAKNVPLPFLTVETDGSEQIFLGTWYNGLMSFNKKTKQFDAYSSQYADPVNTNHYQVLDIQNKDDSTLYLASRNSGLLSFHKKSHEIKALLTNDMLPGGSSSIDIQHISVTPDAGIFAGGNYYIYQQHNSFNRFSNSVLFPYKQDFGVEKIIYDKGRDGYWIAFLNTSEIIFLEKDMHKRQFFKAQNQQELQCIDLAIDKNQDVWAVSANSGLLKLQKSNSTFRKVEHELNGLDTIAGRVVLVENDQQGNLWLITRSSLFYFDVITNVIERFNLLPEGLGSLHQITLCAGHLNDAWVASDKGLFHCIRSENKTEHLIPDHGKRNGIANIVIKSMTVDHKGNAWLGFESDGVQVITPDYTIHSSYNLNDGLPGMQINYMETDSAGRIWAGTSAGLALFDPNSEADIWQLFNREDGIKRDYIDQPIMATEDGKLFFNIEGGVSWIEIAAEQAFNQYLPVLHLTSFTVNGIQYREDILPDYFNSVELSYDAKEISIEYAAMDWLHPSRTKYFYRIDGISATDEWIENNEATILLTGLKPGKYVLRLYAVNGDGIKSNEIELPISMQAPFWQRWWFVVLVVLSIIFLSYAIYRYRIGQIKKLQSMRNTISTNLHDDIGASLSNIHILNVLTQRNISNKESATSYITKAGDEIQRISEALSDIVWNISPKYDDLDNLFIRMKRYAADMLDGKNIKATLIFPEHVDKVSMPMDQRRDFYLIFKEAVNNLVKYAEASAATVQVVIDHRNIRLEVSDNGKGFDEDIIIPGNGIQNMKQRAGKWNADLIVRSSPGKGTIISLEMKVN